MFIEISHSRTGSRYDIKIRAEKLLYGLSAFLCARDMRKIYNVLRNGYRSRRRLLYIGKYIRSGKYDRLVLIITKNHLQLYGK